jgi:hypothetical protein
MSRTIVYIDALNLYYRALRFTTHKWLNLETLARLSLPATCNIIALNYYYAPVSGRTDPGAPDRQLFICALSRPCRLFPCIKATFWQAVSGRV